MNPIKLPNRHWRLIFIAAVIMAGFAAFPRNAKASTSTKTGPEVGWNMDSGDSDGHE